MKKSIVKPSILVIITALFFLITNSATAQTNFSGSWKRNDNKTVIQGISINSVPAKLEIKQDGSSISIKRMSVNGQGAESSYTEAMKYDSSTSEVITPSKLKRSSSVNWSGDKMQLIQTSTSKDDQGQIKQTAKQTYSLIDGGKTLKVTAELNFEGQAVKAEEYFDKQL